MTERVPAKRAPRKAPARPSPLTDSSEASTTLGLINRAAMAELVERVVTRVLEPQLAGFQQVITTLVEQHSRTEAVAISQAAEIGRLQAELRSVTHERDSLAVEVDDLKIKLEALRAGNDEGKRGHGFPFNLLPGVS